MLFDPERVRELGSRRIVGLDEIRALAPQGYLVAQVAMHARAPREELLDVARMVPTRMSALNQDLLIVSSGEVRLPFVVTVAGFVVAAAEAVGWCADGLKLDEPGCWVDEISRAQLPTGRGRGWASEEPWKWARTTDESTSSSVGN